MAKFGFGRSKSNESKSEQTPRIGQPDIDKPLASSSDPTALEVPQPFLHLLRQVKTQPNALALSTPSRDYTFRQVFETSKRIAAILRDRGIKPGDLVATAVDTEEDFLFFAALLHEATIGSIAPANISDTLATQIDWIISNRKIANFPEDRQILIDSRFQQDFENTSSVIEPNVYPSFQTYCRVVFSSGTTGTPKAIPFPIDSLEARNKYSREVWMPVKPFMSLIGMGAVTGFQAAYATLVDGAPYISGGNSRDNLNLIQKNQVASIKCSPLQLADLLAEVQKSPEKIKSLKVAQTAGSKLPNELAKNFSAAVGCQIINLYGATEVGLISKRTGISEDDSDVGFLVEGAEVEIVDDQDNPLPVGQTGTIRWHRDFMATEYFKNPEATQNSFRGRWFYPGDTGFKTEDGRLFLAGRRSELINAGGIKLDPAAIDVFLRAQPGVIDGASFSFNGIFGLAAFAVAVVAKPGFDNEGLRNSFKRAYGGVAPAVVFMVPEIRRNLMGKVERSLHAKHLEEVLAQQQVQNKNR
ncbi:MAG: AMP-binding protein [Micrococcales bacterium]